MCACECVLLYWRNLLIATTTMVGRETVGEE